jgi:UDP-3-O-[3-hydroxymyristoyl] glucosamine N-acyltransferase
MKLAALAERLGCELRGDGSIEIDAVRSLDEAGPRDLTFLANPKYAAQMATTRAGAIILAAAADEVSLASLRAANPYLAFAEALALFHVPRRPPPGVHPTAVIAATAKIAEPASIGAYAVIGDDVEIAPEATIHPHVTIYPGVRIGRGFVAHAGVVIREDVRIGDRVILHPGVVLGADGFGFAPSVRGAVKIPQTGTVVVEDDVEIGANTCIDRGALGDTRIGARTRIDNLVHIAHNVTIGEDCAVIAHAMLAGSVRLGPRAWIAPAAAVREGLQIGADALVGLGAVVTADVAPGISVMGSPARPAAEFKAMLAALRRLV